MLFGRKKQKSEISVPAGLVDLHSHILAGVDDGARDDDQMYDLIRLEYECGVRYLCFTPHYNPALFEPRPQKIAESFEKAKRFAGESFPDMCLYLGNEVFMRPDTLERLRDGSCLPIGGTKTVLTEFGPSTSLGDMRMYIVKLLSYGYSPLIAHIERYESLSDIDDVYELKSLGARLQINTPAFFGPRKKLITRLVEQGVIDVVADDRHSRQRGESALSESYGFVAEKFSEKAAQALFIRRPMSILNMPQNDKL